MVDVAADGIQEGSADREGSVTFLPGESVVEIQANPRRGRLLDFANDVGGRLRWFGPGEDVDMIGNASHSQGNGTEGTQTASDILVESFDPIALDVRQAILGRKDEVVVAGCYASTAWSNLRTRSVAGKSVAFGALCAGVVLRRRRRRGE